MLHQTHRKHIKSKVLIDLTCIQNNKNGQQCKRRIGKGRIESNAKKHVSDIGLLD